MICSQLPKHQVSNTILVNIPHQTQCNDQNIQQITDDCHIKNQEQSKIDTSIISNKDNISYKMAYALLL